MATPAEPTFLTSLERPACAVVVGASGAIGSAVTTLLAQGGFDPVHALSRSGTVPAVANVRPGTLDYEDPASIAAAAAALGSGPPVRFVLVATGLLHAGDLHPEKTYRSLDPENLARSYRVNAIGPALVAKHLLPLLPKAGKAVFAVISARVGSIGDNQLGGWYGYRASKAALNQIVRTLAIELRRQKPEAVCLALHPGTVDTALSQPFQARVESGRLFTPAYAAERLLDVVDGATAADSGEFFAWDGRKIPF
jgi:NAD(P)-dependent dehydrogenase (short-subunit alcohol dehydrogenase family)